MHFSKVEEAIGESILVWYNYIVEKMPRPSGAADRGTDVKNSMQLVRLILSDLKGQCQTLQALFTKELEIDYCSIAFAIYDENVSNTLTKKTLFPAKYIMSDKSLKFFSDGQTCQTGG